MLVGELEVKTIKEASTKKSAKKQYNVVELMEKE